MFPSPLHARHQAAAAEFQDYAQIPIVQTFGQPQAEYAAIRRSVAVMDLPHRASIELTGPDRLEFLNNLLTNQTWDKPAKRGLQPGSGVYAFFLTPKGRIITDLDVLETGQHTLLNLDARLAASTLAAIDRYRFSEKVTMRVRDDLHHLYLLGPGALGVLSRLAEAPMEPLEPMGCVTRLIAGRQVLVYRDDACGVPGYVLLAPAGAVEPIWEALTHNSPGDAQEMLFRGLARPAGWAAFNTTRIEAGRPLFGIDFDDTMLPAETGQLSRAVSFTKGCYVGQEIVARMHARGQVARQIVGIRMQGDALPIAGSKVYDAQDNEVGGITSSTVSPVLSNAPLCLALVKRPFAAVGTTVRIPAEGAIREGLVADLPFVRP